MVYKFVAKNGRIDYVATNMKNPSRGKVETIVKARWSIEVYHRELKQTCGIERCQARTGRAQRNHICMSIMAWIEMHNIKYGLKTLFLCINKLGILYMTHKSVCWDKYSKFLLVSEWKKIKSDAKLDRLASASYDKHRAIFQ